MRFDEWTPTGRDTQNRPGGQRMKAAVPLNEREARQFCGHQQLAEPQFLAELDSLWFLNEQRIRSAVDREAVDLFAEDDAADTRPAFQQKERDVLPMEFVGGCEAANPATDDDNGGDRVHPTIIAFRGRAIRARR